MTKCGGHSCLLPSAQPEETTTANITSVYEKNTTASSKTVHDDMMT